jgi:hypothetical protein
MSLLTDPVVVIGKVEPEAVTIFLQQIDVKIAYLKHFLVTHAQSRANTVRASYEFKENFELIYWPLEAHKSMKNGERNTLANDCQTGDDTPRKRFEQ